MSPDIYETPSGRHLSYESRHRRSSRKRIDRPDLRAGNMVWWRSGLFQIEAVELHGERWIAVLVKPGQVGQSEVNCWFAGVGELQYEPGK